MKTSLLLALGLLCAITGNAQSPAAPALPGTPSAPVASTNEPVNYVISIQWKDPKNGTTFQQVTTTEGVFTLDTIQPGTVKINGAEVPTMLKLSGTLKVVSPAKGRLTLYLGRTRPYVTGSYNGSAGTSSSSYSQMEEGLSTTFIVTFGKSIVVEGDEKSQISVLVKIDEN